MPMRSCSGENSFEKRLGGETDRTCGLPGTVTEGEDSTGWHLGFCLGANGYIASLIKALDR